MRKKLSLILLSLLLCILAVYAQADTLYEDAKALKAAHTLDEQLTVINRIADEHADELENGGWDLSLTVASDAEDMPAGTVPQDWEAYGYETADGFPAELRNHKFLFLSSNNSLAAVWHCRLPAQMRARTVEEAEYALVVNSVLTPSGYKYIPPANSSHRDYSAYILNLKTREAIRFWTHRNSAKTSGKWGELDGDIMYPEEIWEALRSEIWGEIRYPLPENAALIFGLTGKNCYLKGYEGALIQVEVPDRVEGHPVTEIGEGGFEACETLKSVRLPEGIRKIRDYAFDACTMMEEIILPSTLEEIGNHAFDRCRSLKGIAFPDGIKSIGEFAFYDNSMLREITLPASLTGIGKKAFMYCTHLARVVMEHAMTFGEEDLFAKDDLLVCLYLADGANNSAALTGVPVHTVIYAREGSYFLEWAQERGNPVVACENPKDMPPVDYIVENDMEFLLFEGEAALTGYLGQESSVVVPETAGGFPVTRIMNKAVYCLEHVTSITIPAGVQEITGSAIYAADKNIPLDIYIENPEISIGKEAIGRYGYNKTPVTLHAPEGSTAQRYVAETTDEPMVFEPWGEGVNPDARVLRDALTLAEQVQKSVEEFWQTCDQQEYSWLARVPGYDINKPEAAAVLRLTADQLDDLALLMGGEENIARVFATIVNTQWNLPYARAAAKTAKGAQFKAAPDDSCAIAVLCYRSDLVFCTLRQDGSAHAALVCSSPGIIAGMTPAYINGIATQYGVAGNCAVYLGDQVSEMLAK